jgi:hypothetical protein
MSALSCRWTADKFILNPRYSTSGIDGGAMNCYLWDIAYVAKLLALTDPDALQKHIMTFTTADINEHYAMNPTDRKEMGPLYFYNYYGTAGI